MDSLRRKPVSPPPPPPSVAPSFREPSTPTLPLQTPSAPERPLLRPDTPFPLYSSAPKTKPPRRKKILFISFLAVLGLFILVFGTLIWKGVSTAQKIQVDGSPESAPTLAQKLKTLGAALTPGEQVPLRGENRGRINILLLGKAGEGLPGENLTDTLMLVSIETGTKKVSLISLPRDLYITDTKNNLEGKINTFYQQGLHQGTFMEPIKTAVTLVTGEPIDYFFVMDFAGFESVVDALGGITVDVPKDFYDPRYPGKNYSYETFQLKKGWQRLDGATALKYVRERHDDPEGDFGRAKRQQQVLQSIKEKASSPGTYLNFFRINKLFESVAENVETDATLLEMQSFYELSKTLDTTNVTTQVIDAWKPESLLRVDHLTLGGVRAFILVPRTGTWEETRELSKNIFSLESLIARKEAIAEEKAHVLILDSGATLPSAEKLAHYIERELGIQASVQYTPALDQVSYPAMLTTRGNLTKPYSFEELLKRLPLTKGDTLPSFVTDTPRSDFVLFMDTQLAEIFQNADEFYKEASLPQNEDATNLPANK